MSAKNYWINKWKKNALGTLFLKGIWENGKILWITYKENAEEMLRVTGHEVNEGGLKCGAAAAACD